MHALMPQLSGCLLCNTYTCLHDPVCAVVFVMAMNLTALALLLGACMSYFWGRSELPCVHGESIVRQCGAATHSGAEASCTGQSGDAAFD